MKRKKSLLAELNVCNSSPVKTKKTDSKDLDSTLCKEDKEKSLSKYKLLIIDYDGTICGTDKAILYSVKKTFESFEKKPPADENILSLISMGISLKDTFEKLIGAEKEPSQDSDKDIKPKFGIEKWIETYRIIYNSEGLDKTYLFPEVSDVLNQFFLKNIQLVVISNKGIKAIENSLQHFDIFKYFKNIVGETPGINPKPDPMIFEKLIQPNFPSINKKEILVVGDTVPDINFAKNIGADCCWVSYGYGKKEECDALIPKFSISSFKELLKICELEKSQLIELTRTDTLVMR